ncbi:hypothetical protein [Paenibacillus chibensis]|uniref:hypothetical protein n=1 Tax=Paenibacillus chibensis TaxID=59846 RepID=UPI002DB8EB6B|nr:hypothetical protein [Paenibacillus chibensis]MEC0371134.1 hypothetical protein [Paenibacillus chibensis]
MNENQKSQKKLPSEVLDILGQDYRPSDSTQSSRTISKKGVVTVVSTKGNGKRVAIDQEVINRIGSPKRVQIALSNAAIAIGEKFTSDDNYFNLKQTANKAVIYSSQLVTELMKTFGLDFTNTTSITFQEVDYKKVESRDVAIIKMSVNTSDSDSLPKDAGDPTDSRNSDMDEDSGDPNPDAGGDVDDNSDNLDPFAYMDDYDGSYDPDPDADGDDYDDSDDLDPDADSDVDDDSDDLDPDADGDDYDDSGDLDPDADGDDYDDSDDLDPDADGDDYDDSDPDETSSNYLHSNLTGRKRRRLA